MKQALIVGLLALVGFGGWWYGMQHLTGDSGQFSAEASGPMPGFQFRDLDGVIHDSDALRGKVVVLNFWATWCPPCRREMPLFVAFQERYRARGLQVIALASDEREKVEAFAKKYGLNFPVGAGGAEVMELAAMAGNRNQALPFTAIFDRQGQAVYVQAGPFTEDALDARLKPLLGDEPEKSGVRK